MTFYPRAAGTICKRYRNRARTLVLSFLIPFVLFSQTEPVKKICARTSSGYHFFNQVAPWVGYDSGAEGKIFTCPGNIGSYWSYQHELFHFSKLGRFSIGQITQFVGLPLLNHLQLNFFSSQGCQHMRSGWRNKMNGIYCVTNAYGAVQQLI